MSQNINRVIIVGRLTRDSELKYTNTGTAILDFSVAYSRGVKRGDNWEEKSCFIGGVMFGKRAEGLAQYLTKGQQIAVDGELDFEMWEDKNGGGKRSKHSLANVNIQLVGSKKDGGYQPTETATDLSEKPSDGKERFEDDIPF